MGQIKYCKLHIVTAIKLLKNNITMEEEAKEEQAGEQPMEKNDVAVDDDDTPLYSCFTNRRVASQEDFNNDTLLGNGIVFWCDVCKCMIYIGGSPWRHFVGRRHAKAVLKQRIPPADRASSGDASSAKKSKLGTSSIPVKMEEGDNDALPVQILKPAIDNGTAICSDCDKTFSTLESALHHFQSQRHIRKIKAIVRGEITEKQKQLKASADLTENKKQLVKVLPPEELRCSECDIEFNNIMAAFMHYKGKKHAATLIQKALKQQDEANKAAIFKDRKRGFGGNRGRGRFSEEMNKWRNGPTGGEYYWGRSGDDYSGDRNEGNYNGARGLDEVGGGGEDGEKAASVLRRQLISSLLAEEEAFIQNNNPNLLGPPPFAPSDHCNQHQQQQQCNSYENY